MNNTHNDNDDHIDDIFPSDFYEPIEAAPEPALQPKPEQAQTENQLQKRAGRTKKVKLLRKWMILCCVWYTIADVLCYHGPAFRVKTETRESGYAIVLEPGHRFNPSRLSNDALLEELVKRYRAMPPEERARAFTEAIKKFNIPAPAPVHAAPPGRGTSDYDF